MNQLIRHENFQVRGLQPRHVDVWLPPGYSVEPVMRYPVIYMHDGQNLFDPDTCSFGVAWEVDKALTRLITVGEASPAIIVGLWSTLLRYPEYRPARPFDYLSETSRENLLAPFDGILLSDKYLAWIATELKPFIDATYRTLPDRKNTLMMGSSMGGLISLYAICEYPDLLGGVGCVSTHWPAVEGVILPYLREHLPPPDSHRIYFDYGTRTLDALYAPLQAAVDPIMREKGYQEGDNWITRRFPGAGHFERDWADRVHIPLRFLLARA